MTNTAPVVTESLVNDTGVSATDKITSIDALAGSGNSNAVVHFTVDGIAIAGTATANASGAWTFTPPALVDGQHIIVASETDAFGATGTASLTFTLDTTPPTVAITSLGSLTNHASQTVTGTVDIADAGSTVTIFDGGAVAGTATVQANGGWSDAITLANGANAVTAKDTDLAGNIGTSNAVTYTLSTTLPVVTEQLSNDTGVSASDKITSIDTLTGAGNPNAVVHFTVDGTAISGTATANGTGAWTFMPPALADGQHTIVASETDAFGNTGSASLTFTLDTTAPVVAITNPATLSTGQAAQTVGGTVDVADVGSTVTVFDGANVAGSATVQANGTWSTGITLVSGINTITAKDTDIAGNIGTSNSIIDTLVVPMPLTEQLAVDTGTSSTDKITSNDTLTGAGNPNTVVHFTVDGTAITGTTTAGNTGAWTFAPPSLADGQHTIVASETNALGNVETASLTFTLDTKAPVVAITSAGGPTSVATQTVNGTVDVADAGSTVTVLNGATAIGTATVQANGNWTDTVTLPNGTNTIVAKDADVAGNIGTSNSVVYTVNTNGLTFSESLLSDTGASSTDLITSNDTLTGTGYPNAVVIFTIDGVATSGFVQVGGNGIWTYAPPSLVDGQHTIVASETIPAGTIGTASLTFTLDTVAPVVMIKNAGGSTNQVTQTVTGTVDVADAGSKVTVFDGTTTAGTATVQSNGTWSTNITLANGANAIVAKDTDIAGNVGVSNTITYTLNTTAPVVTEALLNDTGASASDKITSVDTLTGSGNPNAAVHFTIDGTAIAGTVTANSAGAWTFTPPALADGQHTIVASETDGFGNTGTASLTFTLDTDAGEHSTVTLSGLVNGNAVNGVPVTASVADEDLSTSGITYTWQTSSNGGATWTNVGTNSNTFTPTEGVELRVLTSFVDLAGNTETGSASAGTVGEPPTLTISNSSLTVSAGGAVSLGIGVTVPDSDDVASVNISGLPSYESVTDHLDATVFSGSSITLSAAEVNSGLVLHSSYTGTGHPVATLSVTATNTTPGETGSSPAAMITVTDPPAATTPAPTSSGPLPQLAALFGQFMASGFHNEQPGGQLMSMPPAHIAMDNMPFMAKPLH